jgi:hypothetical protein
LVNVKYFEYGGGQTLTVQYRGPDTNNSWINIPDGALKSGDSGGAAREPTKAETTRISEPAVFHLYPNPLNGNEQVNIQMEGADTSPVHVRLVNMIGETTFERHFDAEELNEGSFIKPVTQMKKGVYILIITQGGNQYQHRLIINENN